MERSSAPKRGSTRFRTGCSLQPKVQLLEGQVPERFPKEALIPGGVLGELVVRHHERLGRGLGQGCVLIALECRDGGNQEFRRLCGQRGDPLYKQEFIQRVVGDLQDGVVVLRWT